MIINESYLLHLYNVNMTIKTVIFFIAFSLNLVLIKSQSLPCLLDSGLCYYERNMDSSINISIEKKWEFSQDVVQRQTPFILDIDNDCIPEIFTAGYENYNKDWISSNQILVFDSKVRSLKKNFSTFYFKTSTQSFFIYKKSIDYEIIIAVLDININPSYVRGKLVCYNSDNTIKWISDQKYGGQIGQGGSLSMADFNKDGIPEVFIHNNIFNAQTGVLLASGENNGVGGTGFSTVSIAADLDDDPNDLELAAGYTIYKVNINNPNGFMGNNMMVNNVLINGLGRDGLTAIADMNNDQKLDVIVVTAQSFYSGIYVYTYQNNSYEVIAKIDWPYYVPLGVLMVGNLTEKGKEDILLSTSNAIRKFSFNNSFLLSEDWSYNINDGSGYSGISIFDLDNNGIHEIIYRDENELNILESANNNPIIISKISCKSETNFEFPIITDIDGSGQTRICVTCADNMIAQNGRLTIFGPPEGQKWAPARPIWHQYAYNPLMINDDGTVPQYMQNPATYKNGKYNNFMAQANILDEDGRYPVPAASLYGEIMCVRYDIDTETYTVDFTLHNRSDASKSAVSGVPVSFYDGDPMSGGALLGTVNTTQDIAAGQTTGLMNFSWTSGIPIDRIFMVVNTDKSTLTMDEDADFFTEECDYTDNISQKRLPQILLQSQEICGNESYEFYGQTLTTTGIYYHKIPQTNGCDSLIYRLELEVTTVKNTRIETQSCDSYTWNNQTYTDTGEYVFATQSVNGCDSIVTLVLKIFPSQNTALAQSACDSYSWNGQTYTTSGVYDYHTETIQGCDSTVTIDLKIHPSYNLTESISACEDYRWQGTTYTESGIYTFATQTAQGCDSVMTLELTITDVLRTTESISACDSYRWNGADYTTDGQYEYTTLSSLGCDSIVTLDLKIYPSQTTTLSQSACDTYFWNGQTYTTSGVYDYHTETIQGCDSTVTIDLKIHPSYNLTESISACEDYRWQGTTYTESGIYTFATQTAQGCDSVMTLELTITDVLRTTESISACDSYRWNGADYTTDGQYEYTTLSSLGCDSIVTLDLKIYPSQSTALSLTTCDSVEYNNEILREAGLYTFAFTTIHGCDSIVSVDLEITSQSITETREDCDSYTWSQSGLTYDTSGVYAQSFTNIWGCDSTYQLQLTIHPSYDVRMEAERCGSYLWTAQGQTYDESGTYVLPLKTAQGCDSLLTLDLKIHPEYSYSDTIITEEAYTWPINQTTYTESGQYLAEYTTENACDSIYHLYLTIRRAETGMYFPNILRPNGPNSHFTVYTNDSGLTIKRMSVYDRWGGLMFQRDNFEPNDPQSGWNGTFDGRPVVPGVYVWMITMVDKDGKEMVYTGDVTVVR